MTDSVAALEEMTIISNSSFTENTLDIVYPVTVKDSIIGLVRTNITAGYLGNYLSNSGTRKTFILDENGNPLFGYDTKEDTSFLTYLKQASNIPATQSSDSVITDSFSESNDSIYGYCTLYDWIYIVKQDTSVYTSIVSTLPVIFLILLIIVMIVSIQISKSIATKYTLPILELSQKMQNAADGQLDVQYNMEREDEFGILSNNFNQMMHIISTNYNEISEARKELEAVSYTHLTLPTNSRV